MAGCFADNGDETRTAAAKTMADGIASFPDIQANLTTDPGTAAQALLAFVKTPVAADQIVSPPFDISAVSAARVDPSAPVPDCLSSTGVPGCDAIQTVDTCTAGSFSFSGQASRTCSPCDNVSGACTYAWSLDNITFTSSQFVLSLATRGSIVGIAASDVTANLTFMYALDVQGTAQRVGTVSMCSCGHATIQPGPPPTGKPRKLVNSSFVIKGGTGNVQRCGLVNFDANENVTVTNSCTCADGTTCAALP